MASDDFDRRDDGPDDRDRWDDRDDDRRRPDREAARARVATPGLFLILAGLFSALLCAASLALAFTNPTMISDWYKKTFIDALQPGPQKQQMEAQFREQEAGMRMDSPLNLGQYVLALLLNLATVVGGLKMRSLSGYGLAITGAVCGIIPISGCCCLTMPVGIWAVVVLANSDVKNAFRSAA
jgi:hypothetical protein